jgi:protein involved in temperature-dependent protein secretion
VDGTVAEAFIPALYAGSNNDPNDDVKLGRRTDWNEQHVTVGSRMFLVDDEEKQIFEASSIEFDHADTSALT